MIREAKMQESMDEILISMNEIKTRLHTLEFKVRGLEAFNRDPTAEIKRLKRARKEARNILISDAQLWREEGVRHTQKLADAVKHYNDINDAYQDVRKCKPRGGNVQTLDP